MQGKMLSDDEAPLSTYNVKTNDFIHCAISAAPPKVIVQQVISTSHRDIYYIHPVDEFSTPK
jgi:hypothetical protein